MPLAFQESLRVDGGHAACARGRDRLPVHVILNVAARENTGHIGFRAIVSENIPRRSSSNWPTNSFVLGSWPIAKKTIRFEVFTLAGLQMF
jgi:hypothetical protein